MRSRIARRGPRTLVLGGAVAVAALLTASPAAARPAAPPSVDIQTHPGLLAPDGGAVGIVVTAKCPDRWSVVEASVTVSQPQATGTGSFPLTCIGFDRVFHVAVPASSGTFALGTAQVMATVVASRGKTQGAADSTTLPVDPTVLVELASSARIEPGGSAVRLAVTVACPVGATGVESRLGVFQGQTSGFGSYTPVCDGDRRTFDVLVTSANGLFVEGIAQALTFADATFAGRTFSGVDDDGALELVP
jgi:hypothetical protein